MTILPTPNGFILNKILKKIRKEIYHGTMIEERNFSSSISYFSECAWVDVNKCLGPRLMYYTVHVLFWLCFSLFLVYRARRNKSNEIKIKIRCVVGNIFRREMRTCKKKFYFFFFFTSEVHCSHRCEWSCQHLSSQSAGSSWHYEICHPGDTH